MWGSEEVIDSEQRAQYAARDLPKKVEALILFLIKGNLGPSMYEKHLKLRKAYQEAGFYANNIEVGNINLNSKKS